MFRRISNRFRGLPNKVCPSIENLVDETCATEDTANRPRARAQSCPRFEIEASINHGFPRRIAWEDREASEDHNDALTTEWMEKWEVECFKISFISSSRLENIFYFILQRVKKQTTPLENTSLNSFRLNGRFSYIDSKVYHRRVSFSIALIEWLHCRISFTS